jgi:hypothetical protein
LPAQELPQPGIFPGGFLGLEFLQSQLLVLPPQAVIQPKQFPPWHRRVHGRARQLLGGTGQPEQRQEQAPDPQFEAGSRLAGKIQNNQRQQHNQTYSNIMRPF